MTRIDPIAPKYKKAEQYECFSTSLFWLGVVTSLVSTFSSAAGYNKITAIADFALVVLTCIIFIIGCYTRLWVLHEAEDTRITEFVSRAYGTGTSPTATNGYFTDVETKPNRKVAAQLLENTFFTHKLCSLFAFWPRMLAFAVGLIWLCAIAWRGTDITYVALIGQIFFTEEVATKVIRVEWLRKNTERVYNEMYRLFKIPPTSILGFNAVVLENELRYERLKATAAVVIPSKVFESNNDQLTAQFEAVQDEVGIARQ